MQARGEDIPALERMPELDADEGALLMDFFALSQTRRPAMEGIGTLSLTDIGEMYRANDWSDAITLGDYTRIMLDFDREVRVWHRERNPDLYRRQSRS